MPCALELPSSAQGKALRSMDVRVGEGLHGVCAGMVGAMCNNAIGVCGVNQAVRVMGCKFLDGSGNGYTSDAGGATWRR